MRKVGFAIITIIIIFLAAMIPIKQATAICYDDERYSLIFNLGTQKFNKAVELNKQPMNDAIYQGLCGKPGKFKLYIL